MFSNCGHAVHFNKSNVTEIFIIEVNMSNVFYYTGIVKFLSKKFFGAASLLLIGSVKFLILYCFFTSISPSSLASI